MELLHLVLKGILNQLKNMQQFWDQNKQTCSIKKNCRLKEKQYNKICWLLKKLLKIKIKIDWIIISKWSKEFSKQDKMKEMALLMIQMITWMKNLLLIKKEKWLRLRKLRLLLKNYFIKMEDVVMIILEQKNQKTKLINKENLNMLIQWIPLWKLLMRYIKNN